MHDPIEHTSEKLTILREMMLTFEPDVWNFAFSLIRRQDVADDISQDVFLKAYRNLDSFRGESSLKTWLLSITRNLVRDYRRSAFVRRVTLMGNVLDKGTHQSAEYEAIDNLAVKDTWNTVFELPDKLREVLVLQVHHQLSVAEIAAILNISEPAVKSRLRRAKIIVIKMLSEKEGEADAKES